jgi:hypothetical protein
LCAAAINRETSCGLSTTGNMRGSFEKMLAHLGLQAQPQPKAAAREAAPQAPPELLHRHIHAAKGRGSARIIATGMVLRALSAGSSAPTSRSSDMHTW